MSSLIHTYAELRDFALSLNLPRVEETTAWGNDVVNAGPFLGTYFIILDRLRTFAIQGTYRF